MSGVSSVDLNLLMVLAALLEERNLTRAGERVNMSQPTMSSSLARLRRHFGDALLVRHGRQYRLTPLAERLLPDIRDAVRQVERTLDGRPGFDPGTSTRTFSLAMSDYAVTVLVKPLMRRAAELAPGVGLEVKPIPPDALESDRALLQHDLLIAPMTHEFPGECEEIFRDRFVCITDPANPLLADGRLTLDDLGTLPHAAPALGPQDALNPAERALDDPHVPWRVQVSTVGWLPVPFAVAGTDLVAIVPERLARRVAAKAGVAVCEPPFGNAELIEAAWWHPTRSDNPALRWLRRIVTEAASAL
jgi:DNA-binding transcriptional LysR family regulator